MDKINKRSFLGRALGAIGVLSSTPVVAQTLTSKPEALIKPQEVKPSYPPSGIYNYTGRCYRDIYQYTGIVICSG